MKYNIIFLNFIKVLSNEQNSIKILCELQILVIQKNGSLKYKFKKNLMLIAIIKYKYSFFYSV